MEEIKVLKEFENTKVEIITDEKREPLFELYSTGMALGQVKSSIVNGKEYIQCRKDRVDKNMENADIKPLVRNGHKYLTESQLYDLMLEMKTEKVKPFRKWVTNEILPTIRKTGGYVANDDMFIEMYLPFADDNTKNLFKLQLNVISQLNNKIKKDEPLVAFANKVSKASNLIDIGKLAKLVNDEHIPIGRNKLFEWLRNNKFLRANNEPYQQYIDNGIFKVREYTYTTPYGTQVGTKVYVTGKGQIYIVEKLRKLYAA